MKFMKILIFIKSKLFLTVLTAFICTITSIAYSAGFQISEQSGTGLGRAFAGFGVIGDDLFYGILQPCRDHNAKGNANSGYCVCY